MDYTATDYETLLGLLSRANRICVTPNTLTEASNLLRQHREPERSDLMTRLWLLIDESEEIVVSSSRASANSEFDRLGLTDAVLLEVASEERPLITVDLNLYLAALTKGESVALNFREFMAIGFVTGSNSACPARACARFSR